LYHISSDSRASSPVFFKNKKIRLKTNFSIFSMPLGSGLRS